MSKKKKPLNPRKPNPNATAIDPEIAKRLAAISPAVKQSTHEHSHNVRLSKDEMRAHSKSNRSPHSGKVRKDGIGAKKV